MREGGRERFDSVDDCWMVDERLNEGGFLGGIVLGMEKEREKGVVLSLFWFSSVMNWDEDIYICRICIGLSLILSRNERSSGSCFIRYCASSGRDDRKRRGIFLFRIILTIKLRIGGRRMKKFAFKCHNLYRLLSLVEQISRRRENFPSYFFFFFV